MSYRTCTALLAFAAMASVFTICPAHAQYSINPGFQASVLVSSGLDGPNDIVIAPSSFGTFGNQIFVGNAGRPNDPSDVDYISHVSTSGPDEGTSYRFANLGTSDPGGMTFDPSGTSLFVTTNTDAPHDGLGKVFQLSSAGNVSVYSNVGNNFNSPGGGLAFDRTGNYGNALYVGITGLDGIARINGPGDNGTLFVNVQDLNPDAIKFGTGGAFGTDMYFTAFSQTPGVYRVSPTGQITPLATIATSPLIGQPLLGLDFGQGGEFGTDMYITDYQNGSILKIAANGDVSTFATGFDHPTGLAFDGDILYVAENGRDRLIEIAAVPEPGTLAFVSGIVVLVPTLILRRRRK